jgi:ferric-dicitrate binding protein FerR (iron transport regulator)
MDQNLLKKYIIGDATLPEKGQIMEWVKTDPKNMSELQAIKKLQDITLWQYVEKTISTSTPKRQLLIYKITAIAAVSLLLLTLGYYIFSSESGQPSISMQTIHVPAGQRVELTLIDGSNIWLNAGTTFSFPNNFPSDKREVILDGEGYFQIEKRTEQPFIVKTSSYEIKVLGTEFNALAYSKSPLFEVALLKGAVEILSDTSGEYMYLEPYTLAYKTDYKLAKDKIVNYNNLLWKDGFICFDDESVEGMVSKLELYYDVKIIVLNEAFKKRKYTAKFRTKDGIEHIFRVFQLKDKFIYEKNDELNVITIR